MVVDVVTEFATEAVLSEPNWAPLLTKKQEIQLPRPNKLEQCQQGPLTIVLKSDLPSNKGELQTKTDEPLLSLCLLSEFLSPGWAAY